MVSCSHDHLVIRSNAMDILEAFFESVLSANVIGIEEFLSKLDQTIKCYPHSEHAFDLPQVSLGCSCAKEVIRILFAPLDGI